MKWQKPLLSGIRHTSRAQFLASLMLAVALIMAAPQPACADPISWQRLCQGLGKFAGLVTDYRNQGKTVRQAVAAALPELRVMANRVVAADVARQVYATPGLNRDQEVAAIFTKCVAPAQAETRPEPSTVRITELQAIPLQFGPNRIGQFAPDGRDADIQLTWRDQGGGRGQDVFFVTMPSKDNTGWRGVDMLQSSPASVASGGISDEPHRGDDMLRSLRFARGKVNGQNATLLLIADRVDEESAPSATTYEVYRLVQEDGRDSFARVVRRVLPDLYCNADMALTVASSLPLRSSYRGPRTVDGVFTNDGCKDPKTMVGRLPFYTARD